MKQLALVLMLFVFGTTFASAQDQIPLTDTENETLNTHLIKYYSKKDSLDYYKDLQKILKDEIDRLEFETGLEQTVVSYNMDALLKKYNIDDSYEFKVEDKKWFFRRKDNGDN